jgi:hypothetical protein
MDGDGPDLELQGVIVQTLRADPAVTALVAQRIYDRVPEDSPFPYIAYGPSDSVEADAECIPGVDISVQIDVWSRAVGYPEAKRIAAAVRAALHDADLVLAENALVTIQHRQTINQRDPDGLTSHSFLMFAAYVEQH